MFLYIYESFVVRPVVQYTTLGYVDTESKVLCNSQLLAYALINQVNSEMGNWLLSSFIHSVSTLATKTPLIILSSHFYKYSIFWIIPPRLSNNN